MPVLTDRFNEVGEFYRKQFDEEPFRFALKDATEVN